MTRRILRLAGFALLVGLIGYLAINAGLAWMYVRALTHPACAQNPIPPAGLPPPQELHLNTPDGLELRAWYYPSQNGAVVIALGGLGGGLGDDLPPMGFLLRHGYGALKIDSRMCANPPAAVTLGAREILEAQAGVQFLSSRPEVQRIGIFGFSMGGVTAIRTAARTPEIAAVIAEGGFYNMGRDFVEPERTKRPLESLFLYAIAGMFC